jgi:hypothetical protein
VLSVHMLASVHESKPRGCEGRVKGPTLECHHAGRGVGGAAERVEVGCYRYTCWHPFMEATLPAAFSRTADGQLSDSPWGGLRRG